MEDEEEAAKRARLSADNDSAMGDLDPRTRPAVPGSSCEYCVEKVRLESEMVKSRVKLEGLLKLIKTMEQDYYHPVDDSEEYKTYCAEYKAIETEQEKLRGKRNLIPICVELNCEIRKIESDVEDKMHDIEYNSPNRRKIAKARNLFNSPVKLIEISNKYEVLNSEEINETIEVNDNPDNSKQAAEEPGKVEKSKIPPIMLKYVKNYVDILDVIRTTCGPTENKFGNGYIKIFTISIEQYQKVQSTLKVQGFDYYLVRPIDKRPLKVVIKDLPLDHDTDVIKNCLKKHGFVIGKVTRLTQFRTRQPLPFFLVEVGKSEISTKPEEIFKLKNLNHLSITVDPYRGRKKTIQCFKCNRFNHTAELCSMTPRCLKCGQSHTTIECEIKQRIEKPICINCNQVGHVAAYRGCAEFPKLTTAHKNRNNNFDSNKYLVNSNISYAQKANGTSANTLDSEQQMAPPAHRPANTVNNQSAAFASTCIESNVNNTPIPAISGNNDLSVLMTALKELRKLMKEAPQLIAALQAMKYANNTADKL
ncbi:hypothetical protein AVEN_15715-1 [Araneus ventricosus]|uniref:Pre-C2HC domain-containing protein n=1 Tax=Araneus ventricosus TaxID=182803 RepID=A0A4Y2V6S3_ARAVE|nr:hypothetical protein AVEN_15715-1 [Araneus ventricosus]